MIYESWALQSSEYKQDVPRPRGQRATNRDKNTASYNLPAIATRLSQIVKHCRYMDPTQHVETPVVYDPTTFEPQQWLLPKASI